MTPLCQFCKKPLIALSVVDAKEGKPGKRLLLGCPTKGHTATSLLLQPLGMAKEDAIMTSNDGGAQEEGPTCPA